MVEIDGTIQRPDGEIFHITWSLDRQKGFKPVDSKDLLKQGFEHVDPIEIMIIP